MTERPFVRIAGQWDDFTESIDAYNDITSVDDMILGLLDVKSKILKDHPEAKRIEAAIDVDFDESGSWADVTFYFSRPMNDREYERHLERERHLEKVKRQREEEAERVERETYERLKAKFEGK